MGPAPHGGRYALLEEARMTPVIRYTYVFFMIMLLFKASGGREMYLFQWGALVGVHTKSEIAKRSEQIPEKQYVRSSSLLL